MKEGYLQLKINELNDKLTKIEELLKLEDSKLLLLQEKVGEYKQVIKKLKDIQEFKDQSIKEIIGENEKIIADHVERVSIKLTKMLNELVSSKSSKINIILKKVQNKEEELTSQKDTLDQIKKDIIFLKEHNEILMMKLVNRDILSGQDITEMTRRSTKKSEKKE